MFEPVGDDPAAVLARSDQLHAEDKREDNARLLSEAARRFPEHADIQLRAAAWLFDTSPSEARLCIRRVDAAAPSDPNLLTQCGSLSFDLGDYGAAKEYAERVRDIGDLDFQLAGSLAHLIGKLAIEAGRPDMAEQALRLAFGKDPEMAGFGRVLAAFLAQEGRPGEALEVVAEALRHLPDDPGLIALQAELLVEEDRSEP